MQIRIFAAVVATSCFSLLATAGDVVQPQPKAGDPLPGLTPKQLHLFQMGQTLFSTTMGVADGLGPIFNKTGCHSCHSNPVGGWGSQFVLHFGYHDDDGMFHAFDGEWQSLRQEQSLSLDCAEIVPEDAFTSLRLTNSSMAFGLIEAIDDKDIAANSDPFDVNRDGIRGRVQWVQPLEDEYGPLRAGRFGWKAQVATVLTFSADALRNEMGITNRLEMVENAPNGNTELRDLCDDYPEPEDVEDSEGFAFIDRVTHFQRYLAAPPQTPRSGMTGEAVFNAIGCNKCHIAEWTTRNDVTLEEAIRNKTIRPYSDFLLHDMGLLGDGVAQAGASEVEMRTPTLWNLRTRDPMLHNGTAAGGLFEDRVTVAILAHGPFGEGAASAAAFEALDPGDKAALIAFLDSLGRLEFDADGNGVIDLDDFHSFAAAFGTSTNPDNPTAVHDIDQDGDIDLNDFASFMLAYEGVNGDCNNNGVPDLMDLLLGTSIDADNDGIPDECLSTPCPGDLNGDSVVNGADLGLLLSAWGTCPGCPSDLNGDLTVNGADLGLLLSAWGICP